MSLIRFDIWSWFNNTLIPTCQGRPHLLKSIITIIKRVLVRILRNKIREILRVHVWEPLVYGPIRLMVHMKRTASELSKSSPLFRIQPVQPKIKKSLVNIRKCVYIIRRVSPIVKWHSTYRYNQWFIWKEWRKSFTDLLIFTCVVDAPIRPMVHMERTVRELSRYSNISFCGQCTDTTNGSYGNIRARDIFRYSNISLCGQRTDTTYGSDRKSSTRALHIFSDYPNPTNTAQDKVVPPPAQLQLRLPLFVFCLHNCAHACIWFHESIIYTLSIKSTDTRWISAVYVRESWLY